MAGNEAEVRWRRQLSFSLAAAMVVVVSARQ
jgi:hypothetical protein